MYSTTSLNAEVMPEQPDTVHAGGVKKYEASALP